MKTRGKTKRKPRSQNITTEAVQAMVEILDGWGEQRLTWASFLEAVGLQLLENYTRQTLSQYERIRNAFELVRQRQTSTNREQPAVSPQLKIAQDRIKRLEAENTRLKDENNRLLTQFVTWAYNAYTGT